MRFYISPDYNKGYIQGKPLKSYPSRNFNRERVIITCPDCEKVNMLVSRTGVDRQVIIDVINRKSYFVVRHKCYVTGDIKALRFIEHK